MSKLDIYQSGRILHVPFTEVYVLSEVPDICSGCKLEIRPFFIFFFLKDPPPPEISPLPHPDPLPLSRRQMEGAQAQFGPPHRSGGPHTECGLGPGGTHCRDRDRRRTAHGLAAAAGAGHHGTAATPVAHARLPRPGKGCTGNFTDCLIS